MPTRTKTDSNATIKPPTNDRADMFDANGAAALDKAKIDRVSARLVEQATGGRLTFAGDLLVKAGAA